MEQGRVQWIFPPSLALSLSPFDVLDGVAALVDQSLLRQDETPAGEARFWMLATIREFALEQLVAGGEHDRVRCEHAAYYLALAEQVQPLLSGRQSKTLLNRVEAEHDNIRAALRWADACGDTETLLRLAAALAEFWRLRGYLSEGSGWLATALARDAERGEPSSRAVAFARVEALGGAGVLARDQGNFVAARRLLEEGLALRRRFGDKQDVARGLNDLGRVLTYLADYPAANAALEESLATWRAMDDTAGVVALLWCLGDLADYEADYPRARRYDEELLSLVRGTENPLTLGTALMIFGILTSHEGDYATACSLLEECLAIHEEFGGTRALGSSHQHLGRALVHTGDLAAAQVHFARSLRIHHESGDRLSTATALEGVAGLEAAQGQAARALRLAGAADALRAATASPIPPSYRIELQQFLEPIRGALSDDAAAAARAAGRAMTFDEAVAYALAMEDLAPSAVATEEPEERRRSTLLKHDLSRS